MSAAYAKAGIKDEQGENFSVAALKDALNRYEDADIKQTVDDVRQACRVDGVIVLDENGNPMKAC